MIATTSSGRRFAALARYLLHGRSGKETDRVAWVVGRNLALDDPDLAAVLMQATADRRERIRNPVYHLTINFDPADPVTPAQMQAAADRVLADLGLAEHQALLVAHRDRAHPHVHIMVNRVHPETWAVWDRWRDRETIERSLRGLERELGLRQVAGRLYQLEGQERPERTPLTTGERREAARSGQPAFPDRVRAHLPELRAARSWAELEERLAAHGLRLERKGQGLVITDGQHQVKASRVARDLSLRQLEARFGVAYPEPESPAPTREEDHETRSRAVEEIVKALGEHDRVAAVRTELTRAEQELAGARDRLQRLDGAIARVQHASQRLDAALARVYREPAAARAKLERATRDRGAERVATLLRSEPERFGAFKGMERRTALGLFVRHDDAPARAAVPTVIFRARELAEADRALRSLAGDLGIRTGDRVELTGTSAETSAAAARTEIATLVTQTEGRVRRLEHHLRHGPTLALLQRSILRMVSRLEPRELTMLRRMITAPHAAIAFKDRQVAKDILLGREEPEREASRL